MHVKQHRSASPREGEIHDLGSRRAFECSLERNGDACSHVHRLHRYRTDRVNLVFIEGKVDLGTAAPGNSRTVENPKHSSPQGMAE
jgi:hypothetical protein